MNDLILIDFSWVVHRMWWAHKDLQVTLHNGQVLKSGHLYGLCRLLKSLTAKYPLADIVLCLDGVAKHGKSLSSDYKANRTVTDVTTAFSDLGVLIECALSFKEVSVAFHRDLEADEVIAFYARKFKLLYKNIVVYSADCDMLQLLAEDNVYISKEFNTDGTLKLVGVSEYLIDQKYLDKFVGVPIEELPLYRAMIGDSSDNLAGFPRLRKKVAKQIVKKYPSIEAIEENITDKIFPVDFANFLPKLKTNYNIMKLPSCEEIVSRGVVPRIHSHQGDDWKARAMFSLYRIRSVSPMETHLVDADAEVEHLAVREEINSNWRLPNRG